jgi:hypothetical protein
LHVGDWWTHFAAVTGLPVNAAGLQGGRGPVGQAAAAVPAVPKTAREVTAKALNRRVLKTTIVGPTFS